MIKRRVANADHEGYGSALDTWKGEADHTETYP